MGLQAGEAIESHFFGCPLEFCQEVSFRYGNAVEGEAIAKATSGSEKGKSPEDLDLAGSVGCSGVGGPLLAGSKSAHICHHRGGDRGRRTAAQREGGDLPDKA